jgi:hypothetical protein
MKEISSQDVVSNLRKKRRFSFVLKYGLNVRAVKGDKKLLEQLDMTLEDGR